MMADLGNTITWLAVGFLIGVASFIEFVGRMDRSGDSGCFYRLLVGLALMVVVVIVLGRLGV